MYFFIFLSLKQSFFFFILQQSLLAVLLFLISGMDSGDNSLQTSTHLRNFNDVAKNHILSKQFQRAMGRQIILIMG